MKRLMLLSTISLAALFSNAKLVMPKPIQTGDSIAIISPASCIDPSKVDSAVNVLRSWGLVPVVGKYALTANGSYAGTVSQRLSDLRWAFENPNIKAIICTRGGYGSYEVLDLLPKGYFRRYPKWFIGYSDITAIHMAMALDGVMSIHGHMCGHLSESGGTDYPSECLRKLLFGELPVHGCSYVKGNHLGEASGILLGGNFALVNDLNRTRIDPISKGKNIILYLEDVGETIPRVKRMMYHLKMSGLLDRVKGLIFGEFTDYKPNSDYSSMEDMLIEVVKEYDIPVAFHFPLGHVDDNLPLVNGANVTLTVRESGTTLKFNK